MLSRFFVTFRKMYRSAKKNVNCLVFLTLPCINIRCWIKSWSDRFPLWRQVWPSQPHLCCSILSQPRPAHSRDLIDFAGWLRHILDSTFKRKHTAPGGFCLCLTLPPGPSSDPPSSWGTPVTLPACGEDLPCPWARGMFAWQQRL